MGNAAASPERSNKQQLMMMSKEDYDQRKKELDMMNLQE